MRKCMCVGLSSANPSSRWLNRASNTGRAVVFWLVARVTVSPCSLWRNAAIGGQEQGPGGDWMDSVSVCVCVGEGRPKACSFHKGGAKKAAPKGFSWGYDSNDDVWKFWKDTVNNDCGTKTLQGRCSVQRRHSDTVCWVVLSRKTLAQGKLQHVLFSNSWPQRGKKHFLESRPWTTVIVASTRNVFFSSGF